MLDRRIPEPGKPIGLLMKYQGRIFHDLRRSAVRDMIRSGVSQSVAMSISGHAGHSIFARYNITDDADVRAALLRTEAYRAAESAKVVAIAQTGR